MKHAILFLSIILFSITATAWDLDKAVYNQGFDISAQDVTPRGLDFSANGTNLYVIGANLSVVNQYTLSTAWDISTATYVQRFNISNITTNPMDVQLTSNGLTMYVLHHGTGTTQLKQFTLSQAWNVTTATYTTAGIASGYAWGMHLTNDGTRLFSTAEIVDGSVSKYALTTPYNSSTSVYSEYLNYLDKARGVFVTSDGTKLYYLDYTNQTVYRYDLGTAWALSTATIAQSKVLTELPIGLYFNPNGTRMYTTGYNTKLIHEYILTEEGTGSATESVRFILDWDGNSVYNTNYTTGYNLGLYGGTIYSDTLMQDLTVYITTISGELVETLITDNNGKVYPTTLATGTTYNFKMSFLGENISNLVTWTGTAQDVFRVNAIAWYTSAYDSTNAGIPTVTYTLTSNNTAYTQTKTARGTNSYVYFYSTINANEYYTLTATKTGYGVIAYYNQLKRGNMQQDLINPWVLMGAQSFYLTDLNGTIGEVTIYKPAESTTQVTAGEIIRQIRFKLFDQSDGFLTSKDFIVNNFGVTITDTDGVCNEERLSGYKTVCNWADYNTYVGIRSDCTYYNDYRGEYIKCTSDEPIKYSTYMETQEVYDGIYYYIDSCFSTYENILSVMKLSGTTDQFCITRQGTGTCYLDYVCSDATTNSLIITLTREGTTHTVGADYTITKGTLTLGDPYIIGTATQPFTIPIDIGNGDPIDSATTCTLTTTMADSANNTYSSFTKTFIGGTNYLTVNLAPTAPENATSYLYWFSCTGGAYSDASKSGTVYVSDSDKYYTRSPTCILKPSTVSETGTSQLYCEIWTSENDTAITITADTDVGVGETLKTLVLTSSQYFPEYNAYMRLYSNNTQFTNTADGNTYTITFIINGNGYANMSIARTLTIDNDVSNINITDLRFNQVFYGDGETATCTVTFTGTNFKQARAEIYSNYWKDAYENDQITEGQYNDYHYKTYSWDETTADLTKIGFDTYQLSYTVENLRYCKDGDTECFATAGISLGQYDTLICDFTVNYATSQANATFKSSGSNQAQIKMWLTNPVTFMSWTLGQLLNPIIFAFLMFVAFIIVINKRGN